MSDNGLTARSVRSSVVISRRFQFLIETYPDRLKTIPDPPPLLYVSGTLSKQDEVAVAIVGGRRATPAGRLVTEEIASDLAAAGVTIISGLARGIDAAAHQGALAGKGRTIAVLGCGIDRNFSPVRDARFLRYPK